MPNTTLAENITAVNATTTNDVFLRTLETWTGLNMADSFIYFIIMAAIFVIIYISLRMVPNMRNGIRVMLALMPFILVESLITDFGTYTIYMPFGKEIIMDRFIHVFQLLDFVFEYGIFQHVSMPIIDTYAATMPETTPTGLMYWFIALLSFGDTAFQIIALSFGFYAIITLIENKVGYQVPFQRTISVILGTLPSIIMALCYSNPIEEFEKSKSLFALIVYFINTAITTGAMIDLVVVFTGFIISFGIIFSAMSIVIDILLSAYINMNPRGKSIDYNVSISSVTMLLVIVYSSVYLLHPEYSWYKIIAVLLLIAFIKSMLDGIVVKAKTQNRERRNQNDLAILLAKELNRDEHMKTYKSLEPSEDTGNLIVPALISLVFLGIGFYLLFH